MSRLRPHTSARSGRDRHGRIGARDPRSGDRQPDPGEGGRGRRLRPCQHPPSAASPTTICCRARSARSTSPRTTSSSSRSTARRSSDTRPPYLERFIHGAIYEARPEVNAVVHSHAEDTLPFSISKTPLCCVAHVASDMGTHVPVWDIADKFGDATNLLVINMAQGRDMARMLGEQHRGADARPRLLGGRRRPAQAGAAVRCTCRATPASCWPPCGWASSRRMSEGEIKTPQQVPRRLAGNAARLGVLGASAPAAATCWPRSKGGV